MTQTLYLGIVRLLAINTEIADFSFNNVLGHIQKWTEIFKNHDHYCCDNYEHFL
jgi:hypothetical protein